MDPRSWLFYLFDQIVFRKGTRDKIAKVDFVGDSVRYL